MTPIELDSILFPCYYINVPGLWNNSSKHKSQKYVVDKQVIIGMTVLRFVLLPTLFMLEEVTSQ